ncbi:MAG TPA: hypothetical protein VL021_07750 [Brumimicrobium sp.]|nr:hypothetical protein [Brumimicrobium sp.]
MNNDLAVLTTKYVLLEKSPILSVYHDVEGDWQFMGGEDVTEADAKMVSLHQIIDLDPSVQEVLDIETGYMASRSHVGDNWKITEE